MYPTCIGLWCLVCPDVTMFPASTSYTGIGSCLSAPPGLHTITLKLNSTLANNSSDDARIVVTGDNVWLSNITVAYPIYVLGESSRNVSFTDVHCKECTSAVVVTGSETARHGAVPVDITASRVSALHYAVALAHTVGTLRCENSMNVLVQPVGSAATTAAGCNSTDLGELLAVYGESYVLRFVDGPPHKTGALFMAVKVMTAVTVVLLVVVYLSAYHVWQRFRQRQQVKEHED